MGRYISQSDVEAVHGAKNVAMWSNLDSTDRSTTADTDRIATAIENAEDEVDDMFRESRYQIPFVGTSGSTPRKVVDWCAKLAGVWLYESRKARSPADGDDTVRVLGHKKNVLDEISVYLAGQSKLAAQLVIEGGTCPEVV